MNILVVEDDQQLADLLERVFREEGHAPLLVETLRGAECELARRTFDIVVLDWMLPDGEGLQLCRRIRERQPVLPVLMLTARGEVGDRVMGLRTGADEYLTKPFDLNELLARVDAICRRSKMDWIVRVGALAIDRKSHTVHANERRLELTAREYSLLVRLANDIDACVPRTTLLNDVWNMGFDPGSGVIDVHVSRLRDKLGEFAWMIETVRGQGLRLRTQ